uniref:Uncharacterized protein n=1 Tax=Lepeophtheirus salmonis TaxID=72036 RepID=A0A0K2T2K6_LEPSM
MSVFNQFCCAMLMPAFLAMLFFWVNFSNRSNLVLHC